MPKRVQLPDGTIGEFPDDMQDSAIESVLQKQFGNPAQYQQDVASRPGVPGVPVPKALQPSPPQPAPTSTMGQIWHGLTDPEQPGQFQRTGIWPVDDALTAVHNAGGRAIKVAASPILHPKDTAKGILSAAPGINPLTGEVNQGPLPARIDEFKQDWQQSPGLAVENAIGDVAGMDLAGRVGSASSGLLSKGGRAILNTGSKLDEVTPDQPISRRDLYNTAKNKGVQFDAAQATGSPLFTIAKRTTEHSLVGSPVYEGLQKANANALHGWSKDILDSATPNVMSREEFGSASQNMLGKHQQQMVDDANTQYQNISKDYGSIPVRPVHTEDTAGRIIAGNDDYFSQNPQMLKMGGMKRVYDLVKENAPASMQPAQTKSSLFDANGNNFLNQPAPRLDPMADLFTKRSDIMSDYRSPDTVGTRAEGFQKQLVGGLDKDIMENLPNQGQSQFRQANSLWEQMHNTYQNPQSPFTNILRSPNPTQVAGTVDAFTPEMSRQFSKAANETGNTDLNQQFQRQKIDRILDPNGTGTADLKNVPTRIGRLNAEKTGGVLANNQVQDLKALGQTARAVKYDSNPSGSGKVLQGAGELTGLFTHPHVAVPALAGMYGASKLITNPAFVDYLMNPAVPTAQPSPFVWGAAAMSRKPDRRGLFSSR